VRVLVVNAGSSSLKLAVVDGAGAVVDRTTLERWEGSGRAPLETYLETCGPLDAVGHRVVHGGPRHLASVRIDQGVVDYLESISDLAPLHNSRAVTGIRDVGVLLPGLPAVAAFDTAFHANLPAAAATYALPREWNDRFGLRRYGFHGLSHSYAVRRGAELATRDIADLRVITCHLGAGCSLTASRGGAAVDTTMGFTPLEGLAMQTRSGSIDPGLLLWLQQHGGIDVQELSAALEHDSGLRGLSGTSGDFRDVLAGVDSDDSDCRLALDVYVHRIVRAVGAMAASAGGLDLLVFTGGIGEHAPRLRSAVAARLGHLGVVVDDEANSRTTADGDITRAGARSSTVVVTAGEELEIARETTRLVEP